MKRLFDITVAFMLIIISWPLMLVVGIIIKIDSPGPIFYCRKNNGFINYRIGKEAKPFYYFKFRSMFIDDEKVTNFGVFIRRWHFDELPELFLVLTGSMSLVGPRPRTKNSIIRSHDSYYKSLRVKPGMTGPFQISRHNNTIEEVIYLNNWYSDNCCFIKDLIIILKTPLAILRQKEGAKETLKLI